MKKLILAAALFSSVTFASQPNAQLPAVCMPLADFLEGMKKYNEEPVFMGEVMIESDHEIFKLVFVNDETGSWTSALVNKTVKAACVESTGVGFNSFAVGTRL